MRCPCCGRAAVRCGDLPLTEDWIRYGDCLCRGCAWVLPRELLDEETTWTCPVHGPVELGARGGI